MERNDTPHCGKSRRAIATFHVPNRPHNPERKPDKGCRQKHKVCDPCSDWPLQIGQKHQETLSALHLHSVGHKARACPVKMLYLGPREEEQAPTGSLKPPAKIHFLGKHEVLLIEPAYV